MKHLLVAVAFCVPAHLAAAGAVEESMKSYVETEVRAWFADPMVIAAVKDSNIRHAGIGAADYPSLDAQWQAEIAAGGGLVASVVDSAASAYLRDRLDSAGGKITELILMDAKGLNVAVSSVTSDYWQGDEDKHTATYGVGPAAIHISEIELDESSQTYQAQVSFTLSDPATGLAIGAVTVGLDAESF